MPPPPLQEVNHPVNLDVATPFATLGLSSPAPDNVIMSDQTTTALSNNTDIATTANTPSPVNIHSLPNELHLRILSAYDLSPVESTCFGLTCTRFYGLHRALHGAVRLSTWDFHRGRELGSLLSVGLSFFHSVRMCYILLWMTVDLDGR